MKALAQILFEISCTQDFQILFSKGNNSEKGHNSDKKKNMSQLFYHEEYTHEIYFKSLTCPIQKLTDVHAHTDRQVESNMPFQLFQSWGHKNQFKQMQDDNLAY